MQPSRGLTIGALARETRCSVPTIRYYEEIGLLPRASRGTGGQRVYAAADVRRLSFIRRCRDLGFSIEQVGAFMALVGAPQRDCTAARDLAQAHLDAVRSKLKELRALARGLKAYVASCNAQCAGGPVSACVILDDLADPRQRGCRGSQGQC